MAKAVHWQRAEGAVVFMACIAALAGLGLDMPIWVAFLIFFAPDVSFAAYPFGPRIGAIGYNLVHIYAFGAIVLVGGLLADMTLLAQAGVLLVAHTGFDRMLGYGLKTPEGFQDTHMGPIGRARTG